MEVGGQFHGPAALAPVKNPQYPVDRRLSGLQKRSERSGEEIKSIPLPGIEPPLMQPVS
jgi:hypothetical protein